MGIVPHFQPSNLVVKLISTKQVFEIVKRIGIFSTGFFALNIK